MVVTVDFKTRFCLPPNRSSCHLVVSTAVLGIVASLTGSITGGFLGFGAGLTGSWVLFLTGLVALYLNQQRLEADSRLSVDLAANSRQSAG